MSIKSHMSTQGKLLSELVVIQDRLRMCLDHLVGPNQAGKDADSDKRLPPSTIMSIAGYNNTTIEILLDRFTHEVSRLEEFTGIEGGGKSRLPTEPVAQRRDDISAARALGL